MKSIITPLAAAVRTTVTMSYMQRVALGLNEEDEGEKECPKIPNFVDETLPKEMLDVMEHLRRNEELCDVELVADQNCFRAHRVVLAASSMYFRAMFCRQMAESGQRRVVIQGVDADALDSLIKFAYTCSLEINEDNAQSLLAASNFLQMLRAQEACCKFLQERLDCSNCLDIADFAEFQSCNELLNAALKFARRNFTEVSKNDRFVQISFSRLKHFLSSNDLHLPEGEEAVFVALVNWTKQNPTERQGNFCETLNYVKLPLLGKLLQCPSCLRHLRGCECSQFNC